MTEFFTIDYTVAIQIAKPITFEQGRAFYLNPIAMFEGDASAPVKLAIVKSPDGIAPAQNATATDETDTFKRLAPDGLGGTRWALPLEGSTTGLSGSTSINDTLLNSGLWVVHFHAYRNATAFRLGTAFLLNGSIIAQSMMTQDMSGVNTLHAISGSQFTVSGSGGSKTIHAPTTVGGAAYTANRMIAGRVA